MPKFFIKSKQIVNNQINIIGEDVNHISKVLRMKILDKIQLCDVDNERNYLVEIVEINEDVIKTKILENINSEVESEIKITVFQGLPKADKMELIIQKSTELGAKEIIPIEMERSVVKLFGKEADKKIERWQKIAEASAKQSRRDIIPKIEPIIKMNSKVFIEKLKEYDEIIVAYEDERQNSLKKELKGIKGKKILKIAIIIGPEGGFDKKEIEMLKTYNSKIVTLGNRILRTETVALMLISILMYELEGE